MDALFDITVLLQGTKELLHTSLPFLPGNGDQVELYGSVYIVTKIMYDLTPDQDGRISAVPAKVFVRRKTDNDY